MTRKKILMIAYFYPPRGGMGTIRTLKFVKYLFKFNWKTIVLTTDKGKGIIDCDEKEGYFEHAKIVRSHFFDIFGDIYSIYRKFIYKKKEINDTKPNNVTNRKIFKTPFYEKIFRLILAWLQFPDSIIGWYPFAVKKAQELIIKNNIDVIYSTSPPETSHLIAFKVKQKTGIPWIADLRDLWTQNPYSMRGPVRQAIERILEKKVLAKADAIITVSKPLALSLSSVIGIPYNKVHIITNGYDPDDFIGIDNTLSEKFTLTYTGRLYRFKKNPELLFKVVSNLIRKGKLDKNRIALNFYVGDLAGFPYFKEKYSLEKVLNVFNFIPYHESLIQQKKATALLLFLSDNKSDFGNYTGKLFEYIGAGRPILSMPSSSEVIEELLNRTNAGVIVSNEYELENVLMEWYLEYIETGTVSYRGVESEIVKYTREECTKRLAFILDNLISINGKKQ